MNNYFKENWLYKVLIFLYTMISYDLEYATA